MELPLDIELFVEQHFRPDDTTRVYHVLDQPHMSTPRVMRAVLFLSNGSLSMFEYFAKQADSDVRDVLLHAEYETEISEEPMFLRDMNLPFPHEQELGSSVSKIRPKQPPRAAERKLGHHKHLIDLRFDLGRAQYTVLPRQNHASFVACQREDHTGRSTTVRLPLTFVARNCALL